MSIQRFKECKACGKTVPRSWSEPKHYECNRCKQRNIRRTIDPNAIAHTAVTQSDEQLRNAKRIHDMVQRWEPQTAAQTQAQKAAQHRDPRSVAMARQMAHDPRPAARGTQQDPINDPAHLLNPLNPFSPVSPLNPLNDWDDSPHRHYVAPAMSEPTECHTTSHSSSHDSSSYDSGSDSSSYSSGGCD